MTRRCLDEAYGDQKREMPWQLDVFMLMRNIGMPKDRDTPWQPDVFLLMRNIGMAKDRETPWEPVSMSSCHKPIWILI
jgi:hypothetical protein